MNKNGKFRLPFVKPSTLAFLDEARHAQDYTWKDLLHGLVYARWPYLYLSIGTGQHPLAKRIGPLLPRLAALYRQARRVVRTAFGLPCANSIQGYQIEKSPRLQARIEQESAALAPDKRWALASGTHADGYHGKVMPLQSAKRLVQVGEPINLPDLEQVIPYPRARALILKNPESIAVIDCPCRAARPNPCLPLDVCLIVGEPFVSFMLEHNPTKARRIDQARAARILEETDARGNVHHAFFKDAMLGRFYAICNCCDCCCGALHSHRSGHPMLASSGYVAQVDESLCIGCGDCAGRCQFHAISLPDGLFSHIDENACMGCGVCLNACPHDALSLRREPAKGLPLELDRLVPA